MKATHYLIVFEQEKSGAYSAYVAGVPVYAQGANRGKAATAICERSSRISRRIRRSRREQRCEWPRCWSLHVARPVCVTAAALVGSRTSQRKAASSRANGRPWRTARKGAGAVNHTIIVLISHPREVPSGRWRDRIERG